MARVRVARLDELEQGELRFVEVADRRLAIARVGESVYAIDDTCTHHGGPLSEGRLAGTRVTCPWHGWMFDLKSGACLMPARGTAVASYPVTIEADEVWVEL